MVKRFGLACFCLVAMLAVASDAWAQGGRGGGMMGGGMFRSKVMLLGMEAVQDELKLSDDQIDELQGVLESVRPQRGGRGGDGGAGGGGQGGQGGQGGGGRGGRGGVDPEVLKEAETKAMKILEDDQKERLLGIYCWVAGARAILDAEVAKAIDLSDKVRDEAQEMFDSADQDLREKMTEMRESGDMEGMRELMTQMRQETDKEVMGLLSKEQVEKLDEIKGDKFEMPQMGRRGGGGGN